MTPALTIPLEIFLKIAKFLSEQDIKHIALSNRQWANFVQAYWENRIKRELTLNPILKEKQSFYQYYENICRGISPSHIKTGVAYARSWSGSTNYKAYLSSRNLREALTPLKAREYLAEACHMGTELWAQAIITAGLSLQKINHRPLQYAVHYGHQHLIPILSSFADKTTLKYPAEPSYSCTGMFRYTSANPTQSTLFHYAAENNIEMLSLLNTEFSTFLTDTSNFSSVHQAIILGKDCETIAHEIDFYKKETALESKRKFNFYMSFIHDEEIENEDVEEEVENFDYRVYMSNNPSIQSGFYVEDAGECTPLWWAIQLGKKEIVQVLLDKDISSYVGFEFDYFTSDLNKMHALVFAAQKNQFECLKIMLTHPSKTYEISAILSLFIILAKTKNKEYIDLLLQYAEKNNQLNTFGKTQYFDSSRAKTTYSNVSIAHILAKYGYWEELAFVIKHMTTLEEKCHIKGIHDDWHREISTTSRSSETLLHLAARQGHWECVQLLLRSGALPCTSIQKNTVEHIGDPEYVTKTKVTVNALYSAVKYGHLKCVQQLIFFGADPESVFLTDIHLKHKELNCSAATITTSTALHVAAQRGHVECLQELLSHQINPDQLIQTKKTSYGFHPSEYTGYQEQKPIIYLQTQHAYDKELKGYTGDWRTRNESLDREHPRVSKTNGTALHVALLNKQWDCAEALLLAGANPNIMVQTNVKESFKVKCYDYHPNSTRSHSDYYYNDYSRSYRYQEQESALDILQKNHRIEKQSTLHLLINHHSLDLNRLFNDSKIRQIFSLLLKKSMNPHVENKVVYDTRNIATCSHFDKKLSRKITYFPVIPHSGKTLLMMAAEKGDAEIIQQLLSFNATTYVKDSHGRTALDYVPKRNPRITPSTQNLPKTIELLATLGCIDIPLFGAGRIQTASTSIAGRMQIASTNIAESINATLPFFELSESDFLDGSKRVPSKKAQHTIPIKTNPAFRAEFSESSSSEHEEFVLACSHKKENKLLVMHLNLDSSISSIVEHLKWMGENYDVRVISRQKENGVGIDIAPRRGLFLQQPLEQESSPELKSFIDQLGDTLKKSGISVWKTLTEQKTCDAVILVNLNGTLVNSGAIDVLTQFIKRPQYFIHALWNKILHKKFPKEKNGIDYHRVDLQYDTDHWIFPSNVLDQKDLIRLFKTIQKHIKDFENNPVKNEFLSLFSKYKVQLIR